MRLCRHTPRRDFIIVVVVVVTVIIVIGSWYVLFLFCAHISPVQRNENESVVCELPPHRAHRRRRRRRQHNFSYVSVSVCRCVRQRNGKRIAQKSVFTVDSIQYTHRSEIHFSFCFCETFWYKSRTLLLLSIQYIVWDHPANKRQRKYFFFLFSAFILRLKWNPLWVEKKKKRRNNGRRKKYGK